MRVLSAMRIPAPPHAADMPGRRALADMRRTGALRHAECIASHKVQQRPAVFCAMSGAPRSSASRAISSAPRSSALHTISNAPRSSAPRAMASIPRASALCAMASVPRSSAPRTASNVQRSSTLRSMSSVLRSSAPRATSNVPRSSAPRAMSSKPRFAHQIKRTVLICALRHVKRTALCAPDQEYRVYLHHTHTYLHWPCTCIAANTAAAEP